MLKLNERDIPMLTEEESQAISRLKEKLQGELSVKKLILFGSKARGDYTRDSDVDLLVLVEDPKTPETRERLSNIQFDVIMEFLDVPLMCVLENHSTWENKLEWVSIRSNVLKEGIEIEL
jgi:predicted nucleotidyltransferase